MDRCYDEDLGENFFFIQLQSLCPLLYETATTNRWTICVPWVGSLGGMAYSEADFLNHVLQQVDTKPHAYKTLSDKEVSIENNIISTGLGFLESRAVPILFEETFFNKNDESFKVLCVNQPLEGGTVLEGKQEETPVINIQSLDDCRQLLWANTGNEKLHRQLQHVVELFHKTCIRLEREKLRHQVDAANAMFTRAMQIVLKDPKMKETAKSDSNYMDSIKVAVETYLMHGVYRKLFKNISTCMAAKDARLNKITRNLSGLQLRDLAIRIEFGENIPGSRRELSNLNRFSTPLGKLNCIRRSIRRLMTRRKSSVATNGESLTLTTDDLLPILVFLIVKSEMANWWANFAFMTRLRFSKSSNDGEYGFYLASIEAALEHVSSGQVTQQNISTISLDTSKLSGSPVAGSLWQRQDYIDLQTVQLFKCAEMNDVSGVESLLNVRPIDMAAVQAEMCHPLCDCDNCKDLLAKAQRDPSLVTAYSRDDRGYTVLHVAALNGHTEMIEVLIRKGAVVNAADYHGHTSLHIACLKGHQAATLMFLHYRAAVNLQDNDGNTPLHLATANGHEECVKALVYMDQGSTQLEMNQGNDMGDTPLHLAAKWGYLNIVDILLENNASVEITNRRRQSPLHYAHNMRVARRLQREVHENNLQLQQATKARRRSSIRRNSQRHIQATRSVPPTPVSPTPSTEPAGVKIVASNDITSASCPNLAWASSAASVRRASKGAVDKPVSEHEKRVEKLFKSVADGDINMVLYHLGWQDEDWDDTEQSINDVKDKILCHPLCQCEKCQPLQKLTTVPSSGVSINSSNGDGFTPLHVAALHGHLELVEVFLKRGANVNARNLHQECSSLHLACQNNRLRVGEVALVLLQQGAKVNQRDSSGNTPLHYCCLNGNLSAAQVLLTHQAGVNYTNYKGNTPLHEAIRWNFLPMVQLLLDHSAAVNIRNKYNLTPSQLTQNEKLLRVLRKADIKQRSISMSRSSGAYIEEGIDVAAQSDGVVSPTSSGDSSGQVSIAELFAALEEHNLQQLQRLTSSIKTFNRRQSLRPAITHDRSAPRLDQQLLLQLSIQHFDSATLRSTETSVQTDTVVFDEICQTPQTDLMDPQEAAYKGDNNAASPTELESSQGTDLADSGPTSTQKYEEMLDLSPDKNCSPTNEKRVQLDTLLSESDHVISVVVTTGGAQLSGSGSDSEAGTLDDETHENNYRGTKEDKVNEVRVSVGNQRSTEKMTEESGGMSPVREQPPPLDTPTDSDGSDWDIFEEFAATTSKHSH